MRVFDVMTTTVVSVKPEMTVREAAKVLVDHGISGAPVLDADGHLVGILSEGDLIHRTELETAERRRSWWLDHLSASRDAVDYVKSHALTVADAMTQEVISVNETTPLSEVANLMETKRIKRLPVLRDGRVVGIVSRANLVQALASVPEEPAPEVSPSDREIRAMLMGELSGHPWAFAGRNIVVRDGVVHLWGVIWSTDAVQAMRVAAQGIPGVKGFEDHTESYPVMPGI
ncbi:CBS domain-containing protein [Paraburkholderia phenazinium]|jgi:CBS domain-containing protein|uniref:BON domain-containing protein n=1 Tax=Paraburkholderia phenazinium TaxID=60549 RepID=A0A1G7U8E4_9BURK|nr:CBS domain-containing protein [Paraburkholderia phenazinium]SDG43895.1 BON domain-containing protein [Paraburkholderia phenazinium]